MRAVPLKQREANEYIEGHHRHHKRVQGDIFRIGAADDDGNLIGIATVGRPVARGLDDGTTVEVTRLCTDGAENACSFLYSKAARIAKEMGYRKIITYILETETGASLKAAGWHKETTTGGDSWERPNRERTDKAPTCPKQRWARELDERKAG